MSKRTWTDWPECSQCSRRRQPVCPTCGVAGNQFLLAEFLAPSERVRASRTEENDPSAGDTPDGDTPDGDTGELEILLLCPQCDEAFPPRFYRCCQACGCDEGDGIEVRRWTPEPLSDELLVAIGGLFLVACLLGTYFWFLFRG